MPRALRIEYPGAIYHVLNRGDHREPIFRDDLDHHQFLATLAEACLKTDWQVHAFCLMGNHFHLVLETPSANLVAGMRWFLSTYTARFNRRHKLCGHLFSGRYQALIVDGSGTGYLRTVCDYVHLNPVRAKLLGADQKISEYVWSRWPDYLKPPEKRPRWRRVDRLLAELGIPRDSVAGRAQLESYLETRRAQADGEEFKPLRRGWCVGDASFRRELLERNGAGAGEPYRADARRETTEAKARRILREELAPLGWTEAELGQRAKGDARKIQIARRLRAETAVTLKWIAKELSMSTWTHVANRLLGLGFGAALVVGLGCDRSPSVPPVKPGQNGKSVSSNTAAVARGAHVVGKEEAILIAKREVENRGWTNYVIGGCRLNGDHWSVHVERSPAVFGGHGKIQIATNGLEVRYVPGR